MNRIVLVDGSDYSELSAYLSSNSDGDRETEVFWLERLRHWWDNNPACSRDSPRGWILRDSQNIIGFLGNIPTTYYLPDLDSPIEIINMSTWRVNAEARGESLRLLTACLTVAKNKIVIDSTPNSKVAKILQTLRFKNLGNTRISYIFTSHLKYMGEIANTINQVFKATKDLSWPSRHEFTGKAQFECRLLNVADKSFDYLWDDTKGSYVTLARTSDWVNWYCFKNKSFTKLLFGVYINRRLVGFAIFIKTMLKRFIPALYCVDIWINKDYPESVVQLMKSVDVYCSKQRILCVAIKSVNPIIDRYIEKIRHLNEIKPTNFYIKWGLKEQVYESENSFNYLGGDFGV